MRNIDINPWEVSDYKYSLPEYVVDALKRANEEVWNAMPDRGEKLVLKVTYKLPAKER